MLCLPSAPCPAGPGAAFLPGEAAGSPTLPWQHSLCGGAGTRRPGSLWAGGQLDCSRCACAACAAAAASVPPAAPCAKRSPSRPVQRDPSALAPRVPAAPGTRGGWWLWLLGPPGMQSPALGAEPARVQRLALILTAVQRYCKGHIPSGANGLVFPRLDSALKSCL